MWRQDFPDSFLGMEERFFGSLEREKGGHWHQRWMPFCWEEIWLVGHGVSLGVGACLGVMALSVGGHVDAVPKFWELGREGCWVLTQAVSTRMLLGVRGLLRAPRGCCPAPGSASGPGVG